MTLGFESIISNSLFIPVCPYFENNCPNIHWSVPFCNRFRIQHKNLITNDLIVQTDHKKCVYYFCINLSIECKT